MSKKKEKKEKVRYYDDGSTVADMSHVKGSRLSGGDPYRPRASAKAKWDTYWNAVKMMFVPMLVVLVILSIAYMILYLLFTLS
jgi:hypothetical protein